MKGIRCRNQEKPWLLISTSQRKDMGEIISYWHPNITISILDDQKVWPINTIVPPFDKCEFMLYGNAD